MSTIDEIKARLDLIDVVQAYTPLKKTGRNFKGLCPFHQEKTPSFVVFPDTQTWRCFGACGEGGDLFSFVMKAEGWDFSETLRNLAERAGVELEERSPQAQQAADYREKLTGLLNQAADFYTRFLLAEPAGKLARDYVKKRGLTEKTVHEFGIGYAPDGWQTVSDHFTALGYTLDDLIEAGLVIKNEKGRTYDRFRHRLMIPIHDARGNVVGFGARALADDQVPKYLNSPQGELFDKSHLLYGFHLARRDIRETETVVVVEGYMDVIQAHQAGYRNVVAQMGTALTQTQVQLLAKYANRLVMALDSDSAGIRATMRGLNVVHESLRDDEGQPQVSFDAQGMMAMSGQLKLDTRILTLPQGKDPDDFIRAAPEDWPQQIQRALPLVDYVIDVGTAELDQHTDIYERERVARQLLPLLMATENDLQRNQNVQRLAMRLYIPEKDLLAWARRERKPNQLSVRTKDQRQPQNQRVVPAPRPQTTPPARLTNRAEGLERYCLSILLQEPLWIFAADRKFRQLALLAEGSEMAIAALEPFTVEDFTRGDHRVLFMLIQKSGEQDALEPQEYIHQNLTPELKTLVDVVLPEPLEVFHQRTSAIHKRELQSVLRQNKLTEEPLNTSEFLRCVLEMRLMRIERASNEFYFMQQHDEPDTSLTIEGLARAVNGLTRAKELIHHAIQDLRR